MRREDRPRLRPLLNIAQQFYLSRRLVMVSLTLILVVVAADVAMPWLVKIVIDMITEAPAKSDANAIFRDVLLTCGFILGVAFVQYVTTAVLNRMYNRAVYRGSARLRERLYVRMQAQSLNFLAERQIGEILTHLMSDIQNLQDSTLDLASEVPFDVCTLIGLTIAMLILNPYLALIVILVLGASVIFALGIGRRGWDAQSKVMEGTADLTAHIQEGLAAARTLATFEASEQEQRRLADASHRHTAHMEKSGAIGAAVTPLLGFAEYAGIVVVLVFGGWAMLHGSLTAGGLVAFLAYMELSADPMSRFSRVIPRLQKASVSATRLHNLLYETPVMEDKPHALIVSTLKGAVSAEHLHFHYPSSTQPALADICFEVEAAEKVAVVGRNASGKSTLLDLLLRIQEPDQGRLLVDGMDLRDIRRANWRSFIGVVPQDIFLLNRSVADNIALGSTASSQEIRAAAEAAGIADFIEHLPQGYDTSVGERGLFLSGGERQRIAIARLFLREPRILLLDEPTSALDVSYERDLLPALQRLCAGKTTFIVSHRPAVLTEVDKVLLLNAGKQLAFDQPDRIWRDFPAFRDLFPEAWASAVPKPPVVEAMQEPRAHDQHATPIQLNGTR